MKTSEILNHPPLVLTNEQRHFYFDNGYLLLEKIVPEQMLERLRKVTNEMIDQSRNITVSDAVWDLEQGHTVESPRLRRLTSPNDQHEVYWEYASSELIGNIVADLVGPDVKFHHSKTEFQMGAWW